MTGQPSSRFVRSEVMPPFPSRKKAELANIGAQHIVQMWRTDLDEIIAANEGAERATGLGKGELHQISLESGAIFPRS